MNAANQCGKRPTILLVDDHAPTRESYAAFLQEEGYDVVQAAHGGEAILLLVEREVDLAMVDIRMPVLGGIEFAAWLRRALPAAGTPILAITACDSTVEQARMRSVCDDLLLKPCDPHRVASRVRALLARSVDREGGAHSSTSGAAPTAVPARREGASAVPGTCNGSLRQAR